MRERDYKPLGEGAKVPLFSPIHLPPNSLHKEQEYSLRTGP